MARGTLKSVAQAAFQCPSLRRHMEELVGKEVSKECKNLCSLSNPSILRSVSKDAVVKFSWAAVSEELKNRAPFFFTVYCYLVLVKMKIPLLSQMLQQLC